MPEEYKTFRETKEERKEYFKTNTLADFEKGLGISKIALTVNPNKVKEENKELSYWEKFIKRLKEEMKSKVSYNIN